ncbi:MAG: alcohol dehydrogenase catalytic domain-containing protein, partial [Kiritimatiellae bacterium]|nr:alcohol dehydrogenase catalytic domain-containing protein [Kiritimatiellia bacterium]
MVGHEMSGIVREVGKKWQGRFHEGQRVGIQPTLNAPGHELDSVIGYSWRGAGGESTRVRLPSVAMERGCLLPYGGDAFFKCSLAEPVAALRAYPGAAQMGRLLTRTSCQSWLTLWAICAHGSTPRRRGQYRNQKSQSGILFPKPTSMSSATTKLSGMSLIWSKP